MLPNHTGPVATDLKAVLDLSPIFFLFQEDVTITWRLKRGGSRPGRGTAAMAEAAVKAQTEGGQPARSVTSLSHGGEPKHKDSSKLRTN